MSEEIQFRCQECGRAFEPTPDAMVEVEIGPALLPTHQAQAMEEAGQCLTAADLQEADEDQLKEWGLTPAQRDAMLKGEAVTTGGMCICIECQDRLAEGAQ